MHECQQDKRTKMDELESELHVPGPDCVSLKSNRSKDFGTKFKRTRMKIQSAQHPPDQDIEPRPAQTSCEDLDAVFTQLEENIQKFIKEQLQRFYRILASDHPENLGSEECNEGSSVEAVLNITLDFLRRMKLEQLAEQLSTCKYSQVKKKLKSRLQHQFSYVVEGVAKAEKTSHLKQFYTELYITEGETAGVNQEHEIRHLETFSRKAAGQETSIKCEDIFKVPGHKLRPIRTKETKEAISAELAEEPIRTVVTRGVAGVGKTVLTQKFSLDWAESRANQNLQLLFPFTFRELNVLKDQMFSLVGLLHHFFSETKVICRFEHLQVLFIFDGLDECRFPLDFLQTQVVTEATETVSVNVLLVNLIRGTLLPSARLWITTRPAAASLIPVEWVSMVTEVRGFTDPQKKQYLQKRFRNKQDSTTIISHIKKSRSLHIMCHLPIFCWILSTVLRYVMEKGALHELPHTLTQMYIHFLVVQAKLKSIKFDGQRWILTGLQRTYTWWSLWENCKGLSVERSLNLFHCLNELNDDSLQEYVEKNMTEGCLSEQMSPADWSTVVFILLSSNSDLEVFDLKKYQASETALLNLLPVVKSSTRAILSSCNLTQSSCDPLASVLCSSSLTHLDLSNKTFRTQGLSSCNLTQSSCGTLASVLCSSSLTHLDLSDNNLQDSGVELLCDGLKDGPHRLETLKLSGCLISERGGTSLSSALNSTPSHLKELDMSYNHLGPSAELLTSLWDQFRCPPDSLRLDPGGEQWLVPGLRKYYCDIILDPNTAHRRVRLSADKRTANRKGSEQSYPEHRDRFTHCLQILSSTSLAGRCYWEVDWIDWVDIAVSYKGIQRQGNRDECRFGDNEQSWSLRIYKGQYSFLHNHRQREFLKSVFKRAGAIRTPSGRVGIYLDSEAGSLSFYEVLSGGDLFHLHTFTSTFTEPVFVGLGMWWFDSSLSLVNLERRQITC
ncbi:hypothetical protein WMY93_013220 [Mugilogobius chulae]|uniref:Uncharacterized protein n=1 Tax=Mugilogobius chulae TaxID=88201 RepID=A0AAW0P2T4_9GOBI